MIARKDGGKPRSKARPCSASPQLTASASRDATEMLTTKWHVISAESKEPIREIIKRPFSFLGDLKWEAPGPETSKKILVKRVVCDIQGLQRDD